MYRPQNHRWPQERQIGGPILKIAIIGSGISGLTAAHHLHPRHDITLFEAGSYAGGHTNTIDVEVDGERQSVDTGFIVFNDWTYPNFIALLDGLKVQSQPAPMSFSVRCDVSHLEYNGTSLNGLFAQRRNLLRPRFYRMLHDILRFNRDSLALLATDDESLTVGEYLAQVKYGREFREQYLLPMGSAIWSCPPETFARFPIRFVVEFYRNHGLLNVTERPTWRVICGGSQAYVKELTRPFQQLIRLNTPVLAVRRFDDRVEVVSAQFGQQQFDHVVFACHSDQALLILGADATVVERELLGAFPYESNLAVLHTDTSVLPRRRRAWAAWNYHIRADNPGKAVVTYNMNLLQGLRSKHVFCVTLNSEDQIAPDRVLRRIEYLHPIYTTRRKAAQRRHGELLDANRTSFCGAYWGNGFHEDGVTSALGVGRALEKREGPCTAPSMKELSGIGEPGPYAMSSGTGCS